MSLLDKVRTGFDKAKDGINDLAETARLKYEISKLTDQKNQRLVEVGRQIYGLRAQGREFAEVEGPCKEIDDLEKAIKQKGEEIARVNTESSLHPPNKPA